MIDECKQLLFKKDDEVEIQCDDGSWWPGRIYEVDIKVHEFELMMFKTNCWYYVELCNEGMNDVVEYPEEHIRKREIPIVSNSCEAMCMDN